MGQLTELTADAILSALDMQAERVDVPEWGGFVNVRALSGAERDSFEQSITDTRAGAKGRGQTVQVRYNNVRAGLAARCIVDADGKRLFTDAQINELGKKSAAALDRIFDVASRLSGMRAGDVEALTEDFSEGTEGPSTTA